MPRTFNQLPSRIIYLQRSSSILEGTYFAFANHSDDPLREALHEFSFRAFVEQSLNKGFVACASLAANREDDQSECVVQPRRL